jgi:hypothetical protein
MNTDLFYSIMSGICFALTGLWWVVVEGHKDWLANSELRSLAGGVYASFLIPGVMSLGAQIGGDNKLVWRLVFAIAAVLGMYFTIRLLTHLKRSGHNGFFARSRWLMIIVYLIVLVLGVYPELAAPTGLKPIQVEAFLLCLIILSGHGLAWEMMTSQASFDITYQIPRKDRK